MRCGRLAAREPRMLELPRAPSDWAFVGRKAELELALAELDAGRAGLVVVGPPGAGRPQSSSRAVHFAWAGRNRPGLSVPQILLN